MKIKVRTEHDEQAILIAWAKVSEKMQTDPVRRLALKWLHAIPNGFHRGFAARRKGKAEGIKSGVLDLCIPAPELKLGVRNSGGYNGLYLEMKRKGARLRPTQVEFMDFLDLVHYRNALCYRWTTAARIIVEHLDLADFEPIPDDETVDIMIATRLLEEARRLNEIDNPPEVPKLRTRKSRPRGKTAIITV